MVYVTLYEGVEKARGDVPPEKIVGLAKGWQVVPLQEGVREVPAENEVIEEVGELVEEAGVRLWRVHGRKRLKTASELAAAADLAAAEAREAGIALAAQVARETDEVYLTLPLPVQVAFYAVYVQVKDAIGLGRFALARAIVEGLTLPEDLEPVRAGILARIPV